MGKSDFDNVIEQIFKNEKYKNEFESNLIFQEFVLAILNSENGKYDILDMVYRVCNFANEQSKILSEYIEKYGI